MKHLMRLTVPVLLLAFGASCRMAKNLDEQDLNLLCKVATTVQQDASISQKQRLMEIGRQLAGKQAASALRHGWSAVQKAPPKLRKVAYKELLDQAGMPDYRCKPLEQALLN